eukprot:scaffold1372_cov351-Pavlova_lutheri.AAC.9
MAPGPPKQVVVHPLVLLSVVDHYNRVAKDTRKRVVGVLLGETSRGRLDVTNSYAGARRKPAWNGTMRTEKDRSG